MSSKCPACNGSGFNTVDCPYCRASDSHEHEDLTPGSCLGCKDTGYFDDPCPVCHGTGILKEYVSL